VREDAVIRIILDGSPRNGEVRATSANTGWSFLFIWSVSFVWLNQTDQIDQMNQINPRSSRFSRPSPFSQASAIAAEALMNNAG
jgi:hypothetical protein